MEKIDIIDIVIPNLGEAEATEIIELNVSKGDHVKKNDPLITLESEKAAMEIPSDYDGEIVEVCVKEGDKVNEGLIFAKIQTFASTDKIADERKNKDLEKDFPLEPNTEEDKKVEKLSDLKFSGETVNAGPAVRKYARELDLPLEKINGTGRGNRITKDDLKNFIHKRHTSDQNNYPRAEDFKKFGPYRIEKQSSIRSLGARNLHSSWVSIPHVTHFEEANLSQINAAKKGSIKSPLPFIVKVVADQLQDFLLFNSVLLSENQLLFRDYINIGIAIDTPDGLVVPNIKNANKLSVQEITKEITILAEKAKAKKLKNTDFQGSTFTISSLGKLGGVGFTPIINPPEVAILGISRSKNIPILKNDKLIEREIMPFSISYDHRVINGSDAGKFMAALKDKIENYK